MNSNPFFKIKLREGINLSNRVVSFWDLVCFLYKATDIRGTRSSESTRNTSSIEVYIRMFWGAYLFLTLWTRCVCCNKVLKASFELSRREFVQSREKSIYKLKGVRRSRLEKNLVYQKASLSQERGDQNKQSLFFAL